MNPRRALFVDHARAILGGAEVNLIELVSAEAGWKEWEIGCACPDESPLYAGLAHAGVRLWDYRLDPQMEQSRWVGRTRGLAQAWRLPFRLKTPRAALARVLGEFDPNVVITCTNKDHLCAAPLCRKSKAASVWWVNDLISSEFFPWYARWAFCLQAKRCADRLVVVSEGARQALLNQGCPASLVSVIHNGIPLPKYSAGERGRLRNLLGLAPHDLLVGIVGRITPWKGQAFFLDLAREWCGTGQPGHFVILGRAFNEDQEFEAELRRRATHPPLAGRVHFAGFHATVATALADLDVVIHASLRPEPFGRVIIEAMAAGVPVLAARSGGVPEIISDGVNGLLAEPGNAERYYAALQMLIHSRVLRENLAQAGRQAVQERFTLERVRQQFLQLLEEVA